MREWSWIKRQTWEWKATHRGWHSREVKRELLRSQICARLWLVFKALFVFSCLLPKAFLTDDSSPFWQTVGTNLGMPLSPVYGRHLYFLASFGNLTSILCCKPPNLSFLYSLILPLGESTFCELQSHLYSQPLHLFAPADDLLPSKVSVPSVVLQVETSTFSPCGHFPVLMR